MPALRRKEPSLRAGYYDAVVDRLTGRTPALREILPERLDWWGVEAVLRLFNHTSGEEREALIAALGDIITEDEQPLVVAQVVYLVGSLDLAQLEPIVGRLRDRPLAQDETVRAEIDNYFAYRALRRGEMVHADQVGG